MIPVYTFESLSLLSFSKIKKIACSIGCKVIGDLRKKSTWLEAVLASQPQLAVQSVVPAKNTQELLDATQITLAEIDDALAKVALAKQLLEQALDCISPVTVSLPLPAFAFLTDLIQDSEPVIKFWWWNNHHGTVTVDGEKRQFHIVKLYGDNPEVKMLTSDGTWINSNWTTTRNNRYINAILAEIPAHIDHIHERVLASDPFSVADGEIWDGDEFVGLDDDQPPGRGDGRGDGRGGRVDSEWVEEILPTDWTDIEF